MNLGKVSFLPSRLDFSFTILLLYTFQVFSEVSWDARRICRPHARRIFRPHYTDYFHNPFQCFPITIYSIHSLAPVLEAHGRMPYGVIVVRQSTQINKVVITYYRPHPSTAPLKGRGYVFENTYAGNQVDSKVAAAAASIACSTHPNQGCRTARAVVR
jgi:hypothetical protein